MVQRKRRLLINGVSQFSYMFCRGDAAIVESCHSFLKIEICNIQMRKSVGMYFKLNTVCGLGGKCALVCPRIGHTSELSVNL